MEDQLNAFQCIEGHSSEFGFVDPTYHTRGRLHSSHSLGAPLTVQFPAPPTSSVLFSTELLWLPFFSKRSGRILISPTPAHFGVSLFYWFGQEKPVGPVMTSSDSHTRLSKKFTQLTPPVVSFPLLQLTEGRRSTLRLRPDHPQIKSLRMTGLEIDSLEQVTY